MNFEKPSLIISNHVSVLDTPLILSLTSKLVIITNDWIIRSKFTWLLGKYSNFCMIDENIDDSMDFLKKKIGEGYSVLIFPEGISSPNRIKRFHKGAFLMAEQLNLDILPLLIVGKGQFLEKNSFFKYPGKISITILPRITPENIDFGNNFNERTKRICQYYRYEYDKNVLKDV
ncbi:MAG: 1-acyl-sn-glycerol-3-phosphate acyltransferase [Bacteroidetes bacterium]|nr:1-acyl-sn-glycerol-3-phosphate acyltransferase [Bacteroidota bacterium]